MATEYITSADMLSLVSKGMDYTNALSTANQCIEYVAQSLGVSISDIKTPIHFLVRDYAIAYAYKDLYKSKIGTNNVDIASDKYMALYELQCKELDKIRPFLTPELFTGDTINPNNVAQTSVLFRN